MSKKQIDGLAMLAIEKNAIFIANMARCPKKE